MFFYFYFSVKYLQYFPYKNSPFSKTNIQQKCNISIYYTMIENKKAYEDFKMHIYISIKANEKKAYIFDFIFYNTYVHIMVYTEIVGFFF